MTKWQHDVFLIVTFIDLSVRLLNVVFYLLKIAKCSLCLYVTFYIHTCLQFE